MPLTDGHQGGMKFSYYLPCHFTDRSKPASELYAEAEYQAQYAEELGFDCIVIPEHYFMNYISCPSILLFAVKLSQLIGLRIASAVIPLPYYHPLRLAQEVAFADVLTGGRLELGVGRGAYNFEFDRLQISKDQNREIFQESLDIMIKAWTSDGDFSYEGKFFQFPETCVLPKPLQKPHPPIWVAGQSEFSIRWAIEHGYHVMNTPQRRPFAYLEETYAVYRDALESAGKTREELQLLILRNTFVAEDKEQLTRQADNLLNNHRQAQNLSMGQGHVKNGMVEPLDTPMTREEIFQNIIIGDPDTCIQKLEGYRDLGIRNLCVNMAFGGTPQEVRESMRLFAKHVMPCF